MAVKYSCPFKLRGQPHPPWFACISLEPCKSSIRSISEEPSLLCGLPLAHLSLRLSSSEGGPGSKTNGPRTCRPGPQGLARQFPAPLVPPARTSRNPQPPIQRDVLPADHQIDPRQISRVQRMGVRKTRY